MIATDVIAALPEAFTATGHPSVDAPGPRDPHDRVPSPRYARNLRLSGVCPAIIRAMKSCAPLAAVAALLTLCVTDVAAAFEARGSARQAYVTDAEPGAPVELVDPQGKTLRKGKVNDLGAELFRNVKPGEGYRIKVGEEQSDPLTVLTEDPTPPSTDIYDQTLPAGRLRLHDDARRHEARVLRPPAD